MKITVDIPTTDQLPPTREEKFQALREKMEDMMEMVEVGHNEEYCLKCLKVVLKKLRSYPKQKDYIQELADRIHQFLLQQTGEYPE